MHQRRLAATLFRGGTSKGLFVRRAEMPADREVWDDLLLNAFGSPDPMQVDGVGGSRSTASKAMVVSASEEPGVDVDYTFGQVGVDTPVVDWGGNCGNLTFAIGPYALERGLVDPGRDADDGRVDLVLYNTNTDAVVEQSVPVNEDGTPRYDGDFTVHGVPGRGARVRSRFLDPGGSVTAGTFPTGNRTDVLAVEGVGDVEASLVDVASPCVFVRAGDVGVTARERPTEIDADPDLLDRLERVRSAACARYGFVDDPARATDESPGIPKLAVVGERRSYETVDGSTVRADEVDVLARIMSMQTAHHAYAVTGAMCTAVAASLPGTVPNEYLDRDRDSDSDRDCQRRVLGHPKGTLAVGVGLDGDDVAYTEVDRTARQLMHGDVCYLPDEGDSEE